MPFDDYPQYFLDILTCIANIRDFWAGLMITQIRLDRKTEAAIERELQIITEAGCSFGNTGIDSLPRCELARDSGSW